MKKTAFNAHSGFTLIELIIAMGIIGILTTVLIVAINPQQRLATARDAQRKADLRQIADALELYKIDNGSYPNPCDMYAASGSCDSATGGIDWIPNLAGQDYTKNLPSDPINSGFVSVFGDTLSYFYVSGTYPSYGAQQGDYFLLGAWLEDTSDATTLDNLNGRPLWPDCATDIGFWGSIYLIRSYNCAGDPAGAL